MEDNLEFGQMLEQGLVDGLLSQLGRKYQHRLQSEFPQVGIPIGKSRGDVRVDLPFYSHLYAHAQLTKPWIARVLS